MTEINPEKTALIVIDMQNDFCDPDGALFAPPSKEAIGDIQYLLEKAKSAGVKEIIFTKDTHKEDQFENTTYYDEFSRWGEHVLEDSWGAEIIPELNPDENADLIIEKPTYSAFHETELDSWLDERDIENIVLCGTLANVCVLHTASGAALNDYRPIIIEDAIGYIEEDDKDFAINHAEWLFGELETKQNIFD